MAAQAQGLSDLEEILAFQIRALKLPEPVREQRVVVGRRYRVDFCWPDAKLALEVEGGTWIGGSHSRGSGIETDCEKSALLAIEIVMVNM